MWIVVLLLGCAGVAAPGPRIPSAVPEPSTLVASRAHPGVVWTHGDSGNDPVLFAITLEGRLLGRVEVTGAGNVDWEESTLDDEGNLWIADIGNNDDVRRDLAVHRVPEPAPRDGTVAVDRTVRFRYPDQTSFPGSALRFDSEALFWWGGTLWVLTKHRADTRTTLYRFPALEGDVVLERVEEADLGGRVDDRDGRVTACALDAAGERLAVLTYDALHVFGRPDDGVRWLSRPLKRLPLDRDVVEQAEGVAWDGAGVVIGNEQHALLRVGDPMTLDRFPPSPAGR